MFERRVKIFLGILISLALILAARAVQLQIFDHDAFANQAVNIMSKPELIETQRGRILDRNGIVIAEDSPCIDACVDYRVITDEPDADFVKETAASRMRAQYGPDLRKLPLAQRQQMLVNEIGNVRHDISQMWVDLARLGNMPLDQVDEIRHSIARRVEARKRYVWYAKYADAVDKLQLDHSGPSPWYRRWLSEESQQQPELDEFDTKVLEETQAHAILHAISNDANNELGKNQNRYPGLVLRRGLHRTYPYGDVAAQLIGHLSHVQPKDLGENDPFQKNALKTYLPNDLIGNGGLEALCEPILRGSRGQIEHYIEGNSDRETQHVDPVAGEDVRSTIDIELQQEVQLAFSNVQYPWGKDTPPKIDTLAMPGAAVVIDVANGDVLAMASYPSYDLNTLDQNYAKLMKDDINQPLLNRATQFAMEPGSTVKPMVGLGAITQGIFAPTDTIECTGYLVLNGHKYMQGRCWVASMYANILPSVAHHPVPFPHPTGFLTFSDALERSCNVFFETLADRLGEDGLRTWFDRFGLGRPTGVGVAEVSGMIPGDEPVPAMYRRSSIWFSGIGQAQVHATPIQMANVAATIARGGLWMRPHLVPYGTEVKNPPKIPDEVDLHLNQQAVALAHDGMTRVVNGAAGTGKPLHEDDLLIAGKTGSAQAAPLRVVQRDDDDQIIKRTIDVPVMESNGKIGMLSREIPDLRKLELGTHEHPCADAPWYRGSGMEEDKIVHSWFIGFVPADKPKIAFAVFVEYGGSGGGAAASVAKQMLAACVSHGYLQKRQ